jgi:hypothetical protein
MVLVENRRAGLALGEDPEDCRTTGKDERFPRVTEGFVITATASRSLAKLSWVPSTCPMLAVLTIASTCAAGAAKLAGTAKSPATGVRPATVSFAAAASDRDKATTSWRCCDNFRATAAPINPVAPVTESSSRLLRSILEYLWRTNRCSNRWSLQELLLGSFGQ